MLKVMDIYNKLYCVYNKHSEFYDICRDYRHSLHGNVFVSLKIIFRSQINSKGKTIKAWNKLHSVLKKGEHSWYEKEMWHQSIINRTSKRQIVKTVLQHLKYHERL